MNNGMNQNELEHLLLENLKVAKETRDYIRKMYEREQWARRAKIFQWIIVLALIGVGIYFLWPYIGPIRNTIQTVSTQVSNFTSAVSGNGK